MLLNCTLQMVKMVNFMFYVFYHSKKNLIICRMWWALEKEAYILAMDKIYKSSHPTLRVWRRLTKEGLVWDRQSWVHKQLAIHKESSPGHLRPAPQGFEGLVSRPGLRAQSMEHLEPCFEGSSQNVPCSLLVSLWQTWMKLLERLPSPGSLSTHSGGGSERVRPWDVSTLPLGRKNIARVSRSQDTLS